MQQIRLINKLYEQADQHFEKPVANRNHMPSEKAWAKTHLAQE
ncbi:hypothetical protein [Paramylibacter ulvae]|nr:hypothetical protein [Amylibacter ulvae]